MDLHAAYQRHTRTYSDMYNLYIFRHIFTDIPVQTYSFSFTDIYTDIRLKYYQKTNIFQI